MIPPKKCRDCRHFLIEEQKVAIEACNHPELASYNEIGDRDITWAAIARQPGIGKCGPDAKFFEPKDLRSPA